MWLLSLNCFFLNVNEHLVMVSVDALWGSKIIVYKSGEEELERTQGRISMLNPGA